MYEEFVKITDLINLGKCIFPDLLNSMQDIRLYFCDFRLFARPQLWIYDLIRYFSKIIKRVMKPYWYSDIYHPDHSVSDKWIFGRSFRRLHKSRIALLIVVYGKSL